MRRPRDSRDPCRTRFDAAVAGCGLLLLFLSNSSAGRRSPIRCVVITRRWSRGRHNGISAFRRDELARAGNPCRLMTGLTADSLGTPGNIARERYDHRVDRRGDADLDRLRTY